MIAKRSRRFRTPQESKLKPALEKVAKKVYTAAKPAVEATKKAAVSGVKTYLKGTDALAEKLRPALKKLPNAPQRTLRRRTR